MQVCYSDKRFLQKLYQGRQSRLRDGAVSLIEAARL